MYGLERAIHGLEGLEALIREARFFLRLDEFEAPVALVGSEA